jgi:hypothetical protein
MRCIGENIVEAYVINVMPFAGLAHTCLSVSWNFNVLYTLPFTVAAHICFCVHDM